MHTDIPSSLLRELDAVALATNAMVFLGNGFDSTQLNRSFEEES